MLDKLVEWFANPDGWTMVNSIAQLPHCVRNKGGGDKNSVTIYLKQNAKTLVPTFTELSMIDQLLNQSATLHI